MQLQPNSRSEFIYAGNSIFTLVSTRTGRRFTYGVKRAKDNDSLYFVNLLVGPNNVIDYTYLGIIGQRGFTLTGKSRAGWDAPSVRAIQWFLDHTTSDLVEVYHAGKCGRCRRRLTVPESIKSGIGPECAKIMRR